MASYKKYIISQTLVNEILPSKKLGNTMNIKKIGDFVTINRISFNVNIVQLLTILHIYICIENNKTIYDNQI